MVECLAKLLHRDLAGVQVVRRVNVQISMMELKELKDQKGLDLWSG